MNILLINPPLQERTYPGKAMGLDYLAKELIDNGYYVDILDLDVLGIDDFSPRLQKYKPNIVGITNLSIQNDIANDIAKKIKEYSSSILVVKGGFHELYGYEYTLEHHKECVDYVVVGEGEKSFLELISNFKRGYLQSERQNILGLAYYDYENMRVHYTGKRQLISADELNELIPRRLNYYDTYSFEVLEGKKTAQVMGVRGCANFCNFCTESKTGATERKRSIDSIYAELTELSNDGYEAVYFDDSTFTRDRERVLKICKMFKDNFPDMVWGCNTRDDCLDEDLITVMEKSNCVYMFTGFESAVPEVLSGLNKTQNIDYYLVNAEKIYRRLHNSKIKSSVFLIFGSAKKNKITNQYEPETFDDVKESINFSLHNLKPLYLSMNILRLLPGVPFSEKNIFSSIRPEGEVIHAGYYDKKWYEINNKQDIRTTHHIYRAFEAKGSVVPPYMTPEYCYKILEYVVDSVNSMNNKNHYKCKIVVDNKFEDAYLFFKNGTYKLAPFNEIGEG